MAFKLQHPDSQKRISRPGEPTAKMLESNWLVLDALGSPWLESVQSDDLASASANIERKHAEYALHCPSHIEKNWLRENALPECFVETSRAIEPAPVPDEVA